MVCSDGTPRSRPDMSARTSAEFREEACRCIGPCSAAMLSASLMAIAKSVFPRSGIFGLAEVRFRHIADAYTAMKILALCGLPCRISLLGSTKSIFKRQYVF